MLTSFLEIWKDHEQYQKAASFYEKGNLFTEASECYHYCGQHEAAIEVLRRGDQFDELVTYANRFLHRFLYALNTQFDLA